MSEILLNICGNHEAQQMTALVRHRNGKVYYVDTQYTFDCGPETMVFLYDWKKDRVQNWKALYKENYRDMKMALSRHTEIIGNLEKYVR